MEKYIEKKEYYTNLFVLAIKDLIHLEIIKNKKEILEIKKNIDEDLYEKKIINYVKTMKQDVHYYFSIRTGLNEHKFPLETNTIDGLYKKKDSQVDKDLFDYFFKIIIKQKNEDIVQETKDLLEKEFDSLKNKKKRKTTNNNNVDMLSKKKRKKVLYFFSILH